MTAIEQRSTAVAPVAAPLLIFAAELLSPINDATDSSAARVADIIEHSARYTSAVLCLVAGMLFLVPAVLGVRRVGGPSSSLAVGTALSALGFMLFAVASGALGVGPSAWQAAESTDRATLVAVFDAMDSGKGAMPVVQFGPLVALVGLVVVAVGLRGSAYPTWGVVALPLGWAVFLFAPTHAARAIGALVLLAGLVPTIRRAG